MDRFDLPKELSIHEFRGDGPHPLYSVQAVIAGGAGAGFVRRMAEHGVIAVATSETDPASAVAQFLAGVLPEAAPHDHGVDGTSHSHDGGGCGCA